MANFNGRPLRRATFCHRSSMVMFSHKFRSGCWQSVLVRWASSDGACCWIRYLHLLYRLPPDKEASFGCALYASFRAWAKDPLYRVHMPCWPNGYRPTNDHAWVPPSMLVSCLISTASNSKLVFTNLISISCFLLRCTIWYDCFDAIVRASIGVWVWWRLAVHFLCIRFCWCHLVGGLPILRLWRSLIASTHRWKRKEIHCQLVVGSSRRICKLSRYPHMRFHKSNTQAFVTFHSPIFLFFSVVTTSAILENNEILAVLRHSLRTHGPKLWLRNTDDRTTDLYETSASILHQRSESHQRVPTLLLREFLCTIFQWLCLLVSFSRLFRTVHCRLFHTWPCGCFQCSFPLWPIGWSIRIGSHIPVHAKWSIHWVNTVRPYVWSLPRTRAATEY